MKHTDAKQNNNISLTGQLTSDPELKFTSNGLPYCRFTLAVDRSCAKDGAERQADYVNCLAWRGTAELVSKRFVKGQTIAVTGSIQTGTYTDKNNVKAIPHKYCVSVAPANIRQD